MVCARTLRTNLAVRELWVRPVFVDVRGKTLLNDRFREITIEHRGRALANVPGISDDFA